MYPLYLFGSRTQKHMDADGIAPEILSHLPAKSLLRFQLVSKRWLSLITREPWFVNRHDQRLSQRGGHKLHLLLSVRSRQAGGTRENNTAISFYSIEVDPTKQTAAAAHVLTVPFNLQDATFGMQAANGLVCSFSFPALSSEPHKAVSRVVILNPCTRQHITLPDSPRSSDVTSTDNTASHRLIGYSVAFGFDPHRKEYKVLQTCCVFEKGKNPLVELLIFTLGSNEWREIHPTLPLTEFEASHHWVIPSSNRCLSLRGTIYWLQCCDSSCCDRSCILAFDVGEEKFTAILLPELFSPRFDYGYGSGYLLEVQECLALLSVDVNNEPRLWILRDCENSVWEMKEEDYVSYDWWSCYKYDHNLSIIPTTSTYELVIREKIFPRSSQPSIIVDILDMHTRTPQTIELTLPRGGCLDLITRYRESIVQIPGATGESSVTGTAKVIATAYYLLLSPIKLLCSLMGSLKFYVGLFFRVGLYFFMLDY